MAHDSLGAVDGKASADVASALRQLARREDLKRLILDSPPLYEALSPAAWRFVAGERREDAVGRVVAHLSRGWTSTVDYMGENTRDRAAAHAATEEFIELIDALRSVGSGWSISLDLSHIGLSVDYDMTLQNALAIARAAEAVGSEVMISMEEAAKTETILKMHGALAKQMDNVGITLQASLYRSDADLVALLTRTGRIRLVKGAYAEDPSVARSDRREIDAAYRRMMADLLESGHRISIATHDRGLLAEASARMGTSGNTAEFEFLDGAAPDLAAHVRADGGRVRIYVVYGREWYLYLLHRMAEHPANVFDAIISIVEAARLREQSMMPG